MRPCETFMRLCTVPGQGLQISPASFSSDLREDVFPLELSSLQSAVPRSLRPQPQGSSLDARSLENLRNRDRGSGEATIHFRLAPRAPTT